MRNPTTEQIMDLIIDYVDRHSDDPTISDDRLRDQVKFYKLGMERRFPEEWKRFIPPLTPEEVAMEKHPLQFEYCECGCKGHYGASKRLGYWIHNDLASYHKKSGHDNLSVYQGHGPYGKKIGVFQSFDEAVMAAQKDWNETP